MYNLKQNLYITILTAAVVIALLSCSERKASTEPNNNGGQNPPLAWLETSGPNAGPISTLISDSENNIFAGTDSNGVFITSDDGQTWIDFNNGLSDKSIYCLSLDSSGSIFAGTSDEGIFKTTVQVGQWTKVAALDTPTWSLTTLENGSILAGSSAGVLKSMDNGISWINLNTPNLQNPVTDFVQNSIGRIFAGSFIQGLFFSDDDGSHWQPTSLAGLTVLTLTVNSENDIFAGSISLGAYRSTDNGNIWQKLSNGLNADYITSLAINSSDYIFASGFGVGVLQSLDNGDHWEEFINGLSDVDITTLTLDSEEYLLAGTASGMVFRTTKTTKALEIDHGPD